MLKVITRDSIAAERLGKGEVQKILYSAPGASGEMGFKFTGSGKDKQIFTGEMLARCKENMIAGEMMNPADLKAFIDQTIVDVTAAKNMFPTLYQEIYREQVNKDFPQDVKVRDFIGLVAAFAKVGLGESIPLAEFKSGVLEYASFETEATGYQIYREWILFNQLWNITNANEALGRAYNARMDNMHLLPIIGATYSGGAVTAKVTTGTTALENVWLSLRQGIKDAAKRRHTVSGQILKPTVAICNTATAMDVEAAIKGLLQSGSELGQLGQIQKVIAYDGWSGKVNGKTITYAGPADNVVYLVEPKTGFISLVKEERTRLEQKGSVLTLSEMDVAETFTKTLIADTAESVQKVTIA